MTDWTTEQILNEIQGMEAAALRYSGSKDIDVTRIALSEISRRLADIYQEVGKKLL